ncbi:Uma2 family endonuclease [Sphingomonas sp.]|jgi:Uma2 family endonuclease|uniref:Uma2 family endonuclease n=1 Tax=Sphingomonas sp. TaxID=28214 RepID=UPI002E3250B0|nr:Uma2 family endonuclease [Sphingomonas sp.]HEX4693525.1 Uma2 family endonuclease [Sphingomonas sp.]
MTEVVPLTRTPKPVKLRVEDYLALDGLGAFDAYGKTELIEGEVVYMNAQHRPHARMKTQLLILLANALQKLDTRLEALVDGSVSMPPHNVPEPDISITNEPEGEGLIPLASLVLVVEVADTTLRNDLGRKQRIYAREGVPEYWVVEVNKAVIHQMWAASGESYAERRKIGFGTRIDSVTIDGLAVETSGL